MHVHLLVPIWLKAFVTWLRLVRTTPEHLKVPRSGSRHTSTFSEKKIILAL